MPTFKRGHDDYRKLCCFFCLRKAQSKSDRTLSAGEINLIKANFFPDFDNCKDFLPLGCCGTCRNNLSYTFDTQGVKNWQKTKKKRSHKRAKIAS